MAGQETKLPQALTFFLFLDPGWDYLTQATILTVTPFEIEHKFRRKILKIVTLRGRIWHITGRLDEFSMVSCTVVCDSGWLGAVLVAREFAEKCHTDRANYFVSYHLASIRSQVRTDGSRLINWLKNIFRHHMVLKYLFYIKYI